MKQETILQSLRRIEQIIYQLPYDDLTEYLQGVRDVINLVNGEEPNKDIATHIVNMINDLQLEYELPF